MQRTLRQLLNLVPLGPVLRRPAQQALAGRNPDRIRSAGIAVVRALRARGDLVRVQIQGREDDPRRFYALRGHTAVFDLSPFFESSSVPSEPPPSAEASGEAYAHQLDLLRAMERVQDFQASPSLHDGGSAWLEGVLAMLVGYLPDLELALEIRTETMQPDGEGRLFKTPEQEQPFWSRVRAPGQAFRIAGASELPPTLRRRLGDDLLDGADGLVVQAVPLAAPEQEEADPADAEIGLLYIISRRPVGAGILDLAQRLSRFVTHSWRQRLRMGRLVHTDPLTGLHNRGFFDTQFSLELERCKRRRSPLVLLLGDLDHFKLINDTHGHPMGDQVLRTVARELQDGLRRIDLVCRVGGEEFALVLPDTELEAASEVVTRIQVRIANLRLTDPAREEPLRVTVSFGGVAFPAGGEDPAVLYDLADRMLYLSKQRGRNRCHFWRPDEEPLLAMPEYREG